jgi:hypothetical protein
MVKLVVILVILASCSLNPLKRAPSSVPSELDARISSFWSYSAGYILDYRPIKYGNIDEIQKDEQGLYRFLGAIDLGKIGGIPSRIKGRDRSYNYIFNLNGLSQVSYEDWKKMEIQRLEAFSKGRHVFLYEGSFYSLWGIKLKKTAINNLIRNSIKIISPDYPEDSFILSLFNRERVLKLGDKSFYTLPELTKLSRQQLGSLKHDFNEQIDTNDEFSYYGLLNYDKEGAHFSIKDYDNYLDEKYKSMVKGEEIEDYASACDTKVYLRTLSFRKIPKKFIKTLLLHKSKLMSELDLTNNEYDELMILALGILAVESKMGRSFKYHLKEDLRIAGYNIGQIAINFIKRKKGRSDENSRGLTQIKNVGPLLKDTSYGYLENADLDNPEAAALATMFVLREKFGYLNHFKKRHNNINSYNWPDYVYYFYQGSSRQITAGKATPKLNLRIQKILEMKRNMMLFRRCS